MKVILLFNKSNYKKNGYMLNGKFKKRGYDWWWHSFTGIDMETKEEKAFFIEFFITNPSVSPNEVKYGRLGDIPSYLMIKCGAWGENHAQLHKFIPIKDVKIDKAPIKIEANGFYLDEFSLKGNVNITDSENHPEYMSDNGSMSFDLKIKKLISFNVGYGTSSLFRFLKAFEMYWHAEGMKSEYEGLVTFNGRKYIIKPENSYGYADKNWGSNFTSPWIWLSSNCLYSKINNKKLENSVFDIGGGRPKAFGIPFKSKLLGAFYYEGKEYEYNFSKFYHPSKTFFNCRILDDIVVWDIKQRNSKSIMETHIECKKKDMLLVNYEDPKGLKLHNNLYNGGNGYGYIKLYEKKKGKFELIDEIEVSHVGCEYGEFDKK